jgi:hypothetical protein
MATFTASQLTSQVKAIHAGVQSKTGDISAVGVTGTASSVFYLAQVPVGATIVDWMLTASTGGANQTVKIGLRLPISDTWTVTESVLASDLSLTGGQSHRGTNAKLPYKVSLTNNHHNNFAWVQAVAAAALSTTASMRFTVYYTMDDS